MRRWSFDVEITSFHPEPVARRWTMVGADAVEEAVRAAGEVCCVAAAQRDEAGFGEDFYVWTAGGRACVRRDEHREWYALDRVWAASAPEGDVWFRDADGTPFPTQAGETVSHDQALGALARWLRTGELLPDLSWE